MKNILEEEEVGLLVKRIEDNDSSFYELNLGEDFAIRCRNNPYKSFNLIRKVNIDELTKFALALKDNNVVRKIDLSDNQIDDEQAKIVAEAISTNKSIRELYLNYNLLGNTGISVIAKAIITSHAIVNVSFKGNYQIGYEGAQAIAELIKNSQSIRKLDVSYTSKLDDSGYLETEGIGNRGAVLIMQALEKNESVTDINLSANNIDDDSIKALLTTLQVNRFITALDLSDNNIGDEGAEIISNALKMNRSLISINLSGNPISSKGISALYTALESNHLIIDVKVDLRGELGEYDDKFSKIIERNTSIFQQKIDKLSKDECARYQVPEESFMLLRQADYIATKHQKEVVKKVLRGNFFDILEAISISTGLPQDVVNIIKNYDPYLSWLDYELLGGISTDE
jgi:Ran GTPase-activating protein (RanGAP) involved in mRNA processing and transport